MNRKKNLKLYIHRIERIPKIKILPFVLAFMTNENLPSDFEFTFLSKFFS